MVAGGLVWSPKPYYSPRTTLFLSKSKKAMLRAWHGRCMAQILCGREGKPSGHMVGSLTPGLRPGDLLLRSTGGRVCAAARCRRGGGGAGLAWT